MIQTTDMILERLSDYKAPANKLSRMVREGKWIPLTRGVYETNPETPGHLLAGSIYNPSYLSFEYALAYHGLIRNAVTVFTSATFSKRKTKDYQNAFGRFTYRDVPETAYPREVQMKKEGDYYFQIASPEKALCDQLYKLPPAKNKRDLREFLEVHYEIDGALIRRLDTKTLKNLIPCYPSRNLKLFGEILEDAG